MSTSIGQLTYYNVFRKVYIFFKYISDNIQNKEYRLIYTSLKYLVFRKSHSKDFVANTNIGIFFLRAGTMDFISANSAYEFPVMNIIIDVLKDRDLFLDIGANIGTYSVLTGKKGIKTLAFEPIKNNFDSLNRNIELNNIQDTVSSFNVGFDQIARKDQFHFYIKNPGASSLHNIEFNSKGEKIDVELVVFDDFKHESIKSCKAPLVKIDVEGMEIEVLEGMKKFIQEKETIKFIIETKHSGENAIKEKFLSFGNFAFIKIDPFNLLAIKNK